jgi:hypothetical protein
MREEEPLKAKETMFASNLHLDRQHGPSLAEPRVKDEAVTV